MTERSDFPITPQDAATIETYRERVHALYADVRAWLAGDERFGCARIPSFVAEGIGEYQIDRFMVHAGDRGVLDFRPVAAVVLLGAGRVDVWGTVDRAKLFYFDTPLERPATSAFFGIDRPGWYWIEGRHTGARFMNRRALFDVLEEISDFERERN
jgi:hypothetical protein